MKCNISWDRYLQWLLIDRGYKNDKENLGKVKHHFVNVTWYFSRVDFTKNNIRTYLFNLLEAGASPSTFNKRLDMCNNLIKFLELPMVLNIVHRPEPPRVVEALTREEIKAIASVEVPYARQREFINKRNKALYLLSGFNGGNRTKEPLELKWSDVRTSPRPCIVFLDTKSRKDRFVPLSPEIWELINSLPRMGDYVFSTYRGKKMRPQEINLDLKRRAKMCGIEKKIYYYLFRVSYITEMAEDPDINILDVSDIVGHQDPRTTLRYKHSSLEHKYQTILSHPEKKQFKSREEKQKQLMKYLYKNYDPEEVEVSNENGVMVYKIRTVQAAT